MVHRLDSFRERIEAIISECHVHEDDYDIGIMDDELITVAFSYKIEERQIQMVVNGLRDENCKVKVDGQSIDVRE